ncbi:MAG: hypothetical protein ACE5IY_10310 [bacterium]
MHKRNFLLLSLSSICCLFVTHAPAFADPIDDILRIWQETIWLWGKRIFWFFGVASAITIAASPANRKKALYVLGGVILFYLSPLLIDFIQQAAGRPF